MSDDMIPRAEAQAMVAAALAEERERCFSAFKAPPPYDDRAEDKRLTTGPTGGDV